jgi:hypothetical protein
MYTVIAQALGIVAMFFNILSYQNKKAKNIIATQLVGGALFSISFFMLEAYIGAILNLIGAVRALLFLKKDKLHTDRLPWLFFFCTLYVMAFVLNFTVFHKELTAKNVIIECLPVIGMVFTNLGFMQKETKKLRQLCLGSSISWLVYNSFSLAIGAILCEVFSIISIFVGMWRLDKKAKAPSKE